MHKESEASTTDLMILSSNYRNIDVPELESVINMPKIYCLEVDPA
jgi:hypothetical protein